MNNMEQMKALIAQLEALGQAEISEQIQALKQKTAELEAKAIAEAQVLAEHTEEEVQVIETQAVAFYTKYRTELIVAILLILSHVAGKFGL